ncbi:DDE-type integrase/transposase/recombinase [Hoeflea sp.]|uniref:DDE-type integrase/transposase/recombinase n=1 Tax=Hoeflea sp. TaxID=1940281 RepID=UPI003A949671
MRLERPKQVWCTDITYLPMRHGFLYLVARITDWPTRKVLAWRISNTLKADFCVEALNEAIHEFGLRPKQPVHFFSLDRSGEKGRKPDIDEWKWSLPRQRLHRASL